MFHFPTEQIFSADECADIFQQFFSAYLEAEKKSCEKTEVYLRIANVNIYLKFAGKDLARIYSRALHHLQTPPVSDADFTICVWDSKTAGQSLPSFLERFCQFVNSHPNSRLRAIRGDVPLLTNHIIRTALIGETQLTMANAERKLCVHWTPDASEIPYYERGAPLRTAFNFLLGSDSRQLLHGGAVGTEGGGVFLGGIGGSGKSTTALNCVSSELFYAGDDYVVVDLKDKPKAYSLYNTGKVKTKNDLERFPQFRLWIDNADGVNFKEEKPLLFLNDHIPQKLIREIPLKAIVFPRFKAHEQIRCQPMSKQRAYREIATSTVRQTPTDNHPALSMIGKFINRLPCYELFFGESQENVPEYIAEIIAQNS